MNHQFKMKNLAAPLFVLSLILSININSSKAATINRLATVIDTTRERIYAQVERQPQFPGGLQAFGVFLGNNIKYPAEDAKNKIQGRVICTFVVERDGTLTNIKVLRTPTEAMGKEAARVLSLSPKWTPGFQNGRAVRVSYAVPINFNL